MSIVERAFQLAPECVDLRSIREKLQWEGYSQVEAHLDSPSLRKDLKKILGGPDRLAN